MYDSAMSLKVKLHDLVTRPNGTFFSANGYTTVDEYIQKIQIKDHSS